MQIKFGLSKDEILRGYNAFKEAMDSSVSVNGKYISLITKIIESGSFNKSPQIKVGFMLSKKKIPSAVRRNTLRRQLKEIYRLNKAQLSIPENKSLIILFSVNSVCADIIRKEKKTEYQVLEKDILKSFHKINSMLE